MKRLLLVVLLSALTPLLVWAAPAAALDLGWTPQSSGTTNDLMGVDVVFGDASHCWAVGSQGTILASSNGGAAWTPQTSGTTANLRGVDFIDVLHGWAVGDGGTILVTANGGAAWTPRASGTTNNLRGVDFIDVLHGWAVGDGGTILVTADGGATWTQQTSGTTNALMGVAFADSTHGWAVGAGGTILGYQLALDGVSWKPYSSGTTNNLHAITLQEMAFGRLVGAGGTVYGLGSTFSGPIWAPETSGTTAGLYSLAWSEPPIFQLVSTRGIIIIDGPSCWAVGSQGTILFTTAAGPWTQQASGTTQNLRGVAFATSASGWAVGDQGTILYTSTGGAPPPPPDTTPPTTDVSGAEPGRWYRDVVELNLTATDNDGGSGVASTEYRLDAAPDWTTGEAIYLGFSVSSEGEHTLLYRSRDNAGNVEPEHTLTFGVDTRKPTTKAYLAAPARRGKTATLEYKVVDPRPGSPTATVTIKVKNRAGTIVKKLGPYAGRVVGTRLHVHFTVPRTWRTGTYRFFVYAKDKAGNSQVLPAGWNKLVVR